MASNYETIDYGVEDLAVIKYVNLAYWISTIRECNSTYVFAVQRGRVTCGRGHDSTPERNYGHIWKASLAF